MRNRTLIRRDPWMLDDEWRMVLRQRRALLQSFEERGIPLTPFLALLLHRYLRIVILCRRAECALLTEPEGAPPELAAQRIVEYFHTIDAIQLRVNRALLEMEACATNNGLPKAEWLDALYLTENMGDEPESEPAPLEHTLGTEPAAPPTADRLASVQEPNPNLNRHARRYLAKIERKSKTCAPRPHLQALAS